MAEEKANTSSTPKVISKEEADKMDNYVQGLNDEVTHVVDYGGVEEDKRGRIKK
jgi:predicted transcriptional regulator